MCIRVPSPTVAERQYLTRNFNLYTAVKRYRGDLNEAERTRV